MILFLFEKPSLKNLGEVMFLHQTNTDQDMMNYMLIYKSFCALGYRVDLDILMFCRRPVCVPVNFKSYHLQARI